MTVGRKRILIADDEFALRQLVAATLASEEYDLVEAADGLQALEIIQRQHPTLALLDISMPGLDGVEVCRRAKADPDTRDVEIVMLTASNQAEYRDASLLAGARSYLTKPFSPLQLLQLVEEVVQARPGGGPASPGQGLTIPVAGSARPPAPTTFAAFLFADLRGFTEFTHRHGDAAAYQLVQQMYRLVRQQSALFAGRELKTQGDGILMVFPTAHQAVEGARAIMGAVKEHNAANPANRLDLGIGIDVGEPVEAEGDFIGSSLNRASRLNGQAAPGEVMVSGTVRQLANDVRAVSFVDLGMRSLRGFDEPQQIYGLTWEGGPDYVTTATADRPAAPAPIPLRRRRLIGGCAVAAVALLALLVLRPKGGSLTGVDLLPGSAVPVSNVTPTLNVARIAQQARGFTVSISSTGREGMSVGTGIIYSGSGMVVTNSHVVPEAQVVDVHLSDGRTLTAQVLGRSDDPDLAVLRLPEGTYPAAVFADSAALNVGEEVVGLGYPVAFALGSEPTVTRGIVSKRPSALAGKYLQIDASINPGDSGGPLLDRRGEVVGIMVSRIESLEGRPVQGIGFAIPSNKILEALPRLEQAANSGALPVLEALSAPTGWSYAVHQERNQ